MCLVRTPQVSRVSVLLVQNTHILVFIVKLKTVVIQTTPLFMQSFYYNIILKVILLAASQQQLHALDLGDSEVKHGSLPRTLGC